MNNRWKDLAEQCVDQRLDGLHFDKEMFAELIVRQCAKRSAELGQPEIGLGILKHFGVDDDQSRTN
jgi:hypothetical protein